MQRLGRPVCVSDKALHGFAGCHRREPTKADAVFLADAVVVCRVLERQCQQSLLLQVRLMDARKAPGNDCHTPQKARREGSVLAAAALAIVMVTDDDPLDPVGFVRPGNFGDGQPGLSGQNVLALYRPRR